MIRIALGVLAVLSLACSAPVDAPWQTFSAEGDGFVLEAPGTPKTQEIKESVPRGGTVTGRQHQWQTRSNRFYMAMYMAFPPQLAMAGDMGKAMKSMVTGIAQRSKGSIVSEKATVVLELPGTEYEIKMGAMPGSMRVRTVESHGTVYLLAAGWPDGKEAPADEDRFFDSFKLK